VGNVMHNHNADSEACLNRQMLNNYVKRKAMEDLCDIPRKTDTQRTTKPVLGFSHL